MLTLARKGQYSDIHDALIRGIDVPKETGRVELTVKLP